jgi:hypothetical protein
MKTPNKNKRRKIRRKRVLSCFKTIKKHVENQFSLGSYSVFMGMDWRGFSTDEIEVAIRLISFKNKDIYIHHDEWPYNIGPFLNLKQ